MARQSEGRKGRDLTYFVFRLAGARGFAMILDQASDAGAIGLIAFGRAALRAAGFALATNFLLVFAAGLAAAFLTALAGFATFLAAFFAAGSGTYLPYSGAAC